MSEFLVNLSNYAKGFNLDPIVFLIIYFGTTPFILIPPFFLGKIAMKKLDKKYFVPLLTTFVVAFILPYLYVIVFGTGINIFVKIAVIIIAAFLLFRSLSKRLDIRVIAIIKSWLNKLWRK